jgi:hypothetical protein
MEVKVEKVEPTKSNHKGRTPKFPFAELAEEGNTIYVNGTTQSSLLTSAKSYAKNRGLDWKFTVNKEGEGFRIRRIK